ncbi:MAG TPA: hypothetical protein VGD75_12985, partial [Bradyrhizobium sp.]
MKHLLIAAALVTGVAFVNTAGAKEKGEKAAHGKIVSVAPDTTDATLTDIVVSVGGKKNPHDVTIKADKNTQVTVDGQTALLTDLKPGETVKVPT